MRILKYISLYRLLARVLPLKHRLNFLIKSHLDSNELLSIRYYKKFSIAIYPNTENGNTISDLVFQGARYLPEFSLVEVIKKNLPVGFTYVDVGSNIGTTVWLFAGEAKKIIAFEPVPRLYNTINDSIRINAINKIRLVNKAIGSSIGEINMLNNNNSSVVQDSSDDTLKIAVSTLDIELVNEGRVDFIKIDVEGFEMKVLEGASEIIDTHRPLLLIELHPGFITQYGNDFNDVIGFIEGKKYKIVYYSFLQELRMHRLVRFLNRWTNFVGKKMDTKQMFVQDVSRTPKLLSYHLLCEPQ